ncbi:putative transporter, partial [Lachnellula suecica]
MAIFSKSKKDETSAADDTMADKTATPRDPEKADAMALEDGTIATGTPHIDPVFEKRLVRKLDRRLLSLVFVLYLLSYLDRSNIGNAKIAGLDTDLNLSSPDYQWLLTIFYISYIVFEWLTMMWKLVPSHMWAAFVVIGWGITATLQSATFSFSGMMAARFFLGLFEAGFGPGIPYFLSFFYLRHEIGFRTGIYLSAAPLATCFAGALAYGITSDNSPPFANWRILFLVEGLPCVVAGIVTFFIMPDSPEKASFLTAEEKAVARSRALRQVGSAEAHRVGKIDWADIRAALLDAKNYFTALMYFSCNV